MDTIAIFSAKYLFLAPILLLAAYFLRQSLPVKKRMILFALPALILSYLIGLAGNHLYFDPRPFVVDNYVPLILHTPDNGFPSDHTLLVSTVAAVGLYWNMRLGAALGVFAAIVAVARVYVKLHHPIDVLGSAVIALGTVSAVYAAFKYGWHKEII